MSEQNQRSEELFEALSKNKKLRKRKLIRNVVIVIAVIALILVAVVLRLRHNVEERFAAEAADVLDYRVTTGSIHTIVSGSGVLAEVDVEQLTVPVGVTVNEIEVEAGDTVAQGDLLATVDMATVMTTLSSLQDQLSDLDQDINSAKGETVSSTVTAGVTGRVKRVFAQKDMDVSSCMAQHGALAVLSLDGYMALDLETDKVSKGDTVNVTRQDGTVLEGNVDSVTGTRVTVLVTDNGPEYDEEVSVTAKDGTDLGKAKLYIHNPLAVTGYAGTVSSVSAKENGWVSSSSTLFTLKNTSFSANYDTLLRDRAELEEDLLGLLTIYRDGAILAPMDGTISSVDLDTDSDTYLTNEDGMLVLSLYPNREMSITIGIDETDILALEEGQEAQVEVSSVGEDLFTGAVTAISKVADTSTGVTQYSAEVTVPRAPGMLAGMTADVDVRIQGVADAIIIPVDALHQTSAISFVYTTYDPETQQYGGRKEVTTGMQNDDYVEILSGLELGETVYYTERQGMFNIFNMMMGGGMAGGMSGGSSGRPSGNMGGSMPSGGMPGGMTRGG